MTVTVDVVLYVLAIVCFVVAALGLAVGRVNLIALGLALFVLAKLV